MSEKRLPPVVSISLSNRLAHSEVSERVPGYGPVLRVQVCRLGDDMCCFACKFFSDSPPSEPTESDFSAALKREVCFYD